MNIAKINKKIKEEFDNLKTKTQLMDRMVENLPTTSIISDPEQNNLTVKFDLDEEGQLYLALGHNYTDEGKVKFETDLLLDIKEMKSLKKFLNELELENENED